MDIQTIGWIILGLVIVGALLNRKVRETITNLIQERLDDYKHEKDLERMAYREQIKNVAVMRGIQKANSKLITPVKGQPQGLGSNLKKIINEANKKGKGMELNIKEPKEQKTEEFKNIKKMIGVK